MNLDSMPGPILIASNESRKNGDSRSKRELQWTRSDAGRAAKERDEDSFVPPGILVEKNQHLPPRRQRASESNSGSTHSNLFVIDERASVRSADRKQHFIQPR